MDWLIFLVRATVWLTFLLLIAEGIAAIILAKRAARNYVSKHNALEARVGAIERRLQINTEK